MAETASWDQRCATQVAGDFPRFWTGLGRRARYAEMGRKLRKEPNNYVMAKHGQSEGVPLGSPGALLGMDFPARSWAPNISRDATDANRVHPASGWNSLVHLLQKPITRRQ